MNLRYKLMNFLSGRYMNYGIDLLTKVIAITCIILSVVNLFLNSIIIYIVETALFVWMFFRLFSRNINARIQENRKLTNIISKIKASKAFNERKRREKSTHVYKKCPHCSAMLRLPRKPGEHTTKCPSCKNTFKVKVR